MLGVMRVTSSWSASVAVLIFSRVLMTNDPTSVVSASKVSPPPRLVAV